MQRCQGGESYGGSMNKELCRHCKVDSLNRCTLGHSLSWQLELIWDSVDTTIALSKRKSKTIYVGGGQ